MSNLILDGYTGTDSGAEVIGNVRASFPFSAFGDQATAFYEQDYQQLGTSFAALSPNAICPWDASAYLVEETERRPVLGGVVQWTRKYAQIPVSRDDAASLAFQFPGLFGSYFSVSSYVTVTLRLPQTWAGNCRLRQEYFLIGTGGSYATVQLVPVIQKTYFYAPIFNGVLNVSPGQGSDVTFLNSVHQPAQTVPTTEQYQAWCSGGATGQYGAGLGEFIAEASQLTRWKGNIFNRTTKYILAR